MCLHNRKIAAVYSAAIILTMCTVFLCGCDNAGKVPKGVNHIDYKVIESYSNDDVIGILEVPQDERKEKNKIELPDGQYVINTNSKKIHLPTCPGVQTISEKNFGICDNYEKAINDGYKPCGTCFKNK